MNARYGPFQFYINKCTYYVEIALSKCHILLTVLYYVVLFKDEDISLKYSMYMYYLQVFVMIVCCDQTRRHILHTVGRI